jgi:FkbM family methyltransferase
MKKSNEVILNTYPKNTYKTKVKGFLYWFFSKIKPNSTLQTRTFTGTKYYVYLSDQSAINTYVHGILREKERPLIRFLIRNLKSGDCFIDIGAHYGFYSVLASEILFEGNVYCYEASPKMYSLLLKNTESFSNCRVLNKAVTDSNGITTFYESFKNGNSSLSSLNANTAQEKGFAGNSVKVHTVKIDNELINLDRVDYIKVDVEGMEEKVLKGSSEVISKFKPTIAIEIWKERNDRLLKIIRDLNYTVYKLNEEGSIVPINTDQIFNHINGNYDNFILKYEK